MIQCSGEVQPEQEEILPDSFVESLPRHPDADHLPHDTHVPLVMFYFLNIDYLPFNI